MAGIYIHIPFCRQACHYCNFHFSTTFDSYRTALMVALQREIILQKDFFGKGNSILDSVYFGGGTPSLLLPAEMDAIWETLFKYFELKPNAEITLEANPDDLNIDFFEMLQKSPINRLSIGVQSFNDNDLQYLNRVHNGKSAAKAIEKAFQYGISSISADLIFGIPGSSTAILAENIQMLSQLGVDHISAYGLTVEPKTALDHLIKTKKSAPVDDEKTALEMEWLMDALPANGYHQYEISNFAIPGHEAKHNSSYWTGKPYLGIGPSAHSFKNNVRSWNIASNTSYIKSISQGILPQESEILGIVDAYNEYIMTGLRTAKGIDLSIIAEKFGEKVELHFLELIQLFLKEGDVLVEGYTYTLSKKGKLIADYISQHLFLLKRDELDE